MRQASRSSRELSPQQLVQEKEPPMEEPSSAGTVKEESVAAVDVKSELPASEGPQQPVPGLADVGPEAEAPKPMTWGFTRLCLGLTE